MLCHFKPPFPTFVGTTTSGEIKLGNFLAEVHNALKRCHVFAQAPQHACWKGRCCCLLLQGLVSIEKPFLRFKDSLLNVCGQNAGCGQELPQLFLLRLLAHG